MRSAQGLSWLHAGAHATGPALLTAAAAAAVLGALRGQLIDPQTFAFAATVLVGVVALASLGCSVLWQTGARQMALAGVTFVAVSTAGALLFVVRALQMPTVSTDALTLDERVPLVVVRDGAARRLTHPVLGFSILHPGPAWEPADPASGGLGSDDAMHLWAYMAQDELNVLMVGLVRGARSLDGLQALLEALWTGAGGAISGASTHRIAEPAGADPGGGHPEVSLEGALTSGVHLLARAHSVHLGPLRRGYVVLVAAFTTRPATVSAVVQSYRPP